MITLLKSILTQDIRREADTKKPALALAPTSVGAQWQSYEAPIPLVPTVL